MKRCRLILLAAVMIVSAACAAKYRTVRVAPRVDLTQLDVIAVIQFDANRSGELGPLATRRFTDLARRDQGLVRMLVVDPDDDRRDGGALQNLGRRHGARTVLTGRLDISDIRPHVSIDNALRSGSLSADVDATLTVELVETDSGAAIWSASGRASRTIGQVDVLGGGQFRFGAEHPDEAYGPLIDALVAQVTTDFRASWVREPIAR